MTSEVTKSKSSDLTEDEKIRALMGGNVDIRSTHDRLIIHYCLDTPTPCHVFVLYKNGTMTQEN